MRFHFRTAFGLALWFASTHVLAFDEVEHDLIGRTSYAAACEHLRAHLALSSDSTELIELFCSEQFFVRYGEVGRVMGDRVPSRESLLAYFSETGRSASSTWTFLDLALTEAAHFQPDSRELWKHFHAQAMEYARQTYTVAGAGRRQVFLTALALNALGDHFLHDSFAAGHASIDLNGLSASRARSLHDFLNQRGRMLRNQHGDEWWARGDGSYATMDEHAKGVVLSATTASIESLLYTAVTGQAQPALEWRVTSLMPIDARVLEWDCGRVPEDTDDEPVVPVGKCEPTETQNWDSIDRTYGPAEVTEYLLLGVQYQRLDLIDDYGARWDYDLRWLRLGVTFGYAHNKSWGPGFFIGAHGYLVPIRLAHPESRFAHELLLGAEGRVNNFDRDSTVDDPQRGRHAAVLTLTADVAYRLYVNIAGFHALWVEPMFGYCLMRKSYYAPPVRFAETTGAWMFGVSLGVAFALRVSGEGER